MFSSLAICLIPVWLQDQGRFIISILILTLRCCPLHTYVRCKSICCLRQAFPTYTMPESLSYIASISCRRRTCCFGRHLAAPFDSVAGNVRMYQFILCLYALSICRKPLSESSLIHVFYFLCKRLWAETHAQLQH